MSSKNPEADDPMELVGVVLPADPEAQREMAYVFAEEFARMGYNRNALLALFKTPFFAAAHGAYRALGEKAIRSIIDECVDAWGGMVARDRDSCSPQARATNAVSRR